MKRGDYGQCQSIKPQPQVKKFSSHSFLSFPYNRSITKKTSPSFAGPKNTVLKKSLVPLVAAGHWNPRLHGCDKPVIPMFARYAKHL